MKWNDIWIIFDFIWFELVLLIWFDLIWLKLNWFDLIWFDLIWFDLNWIELNWIDWEASERHLGGIWETSGLQGNTQETPRRHPGDTKEAPRRHPGGTQEAPRGTQGTRESPGGLGSKKVNTSKLKCKKWKIWPFHEVFLKVGVTKYRAWRQNLSDTLRRGNSTPPRALYQNRQNPYRWNLFGE